LTGNGYQTVLRRSHGSTVEFIVLSGFLEIVPGVLPALCQLQLPTGKRL
jgi:hypothetical protein